MFILSHYCNYHIPLHNNIPLLSLISQNTFSSYHKHLKKIFHRYIFALVSQSYIWILTSFICIRICQTNPNNKILYTRKFHAFSFQHFFVYKQSACLYAPRYFMLQCTMFTRGTSVLKTLNLIHLCKWILMTSNLTPKILSCHRRKVNFSILI